MMKINRTGILKTFTHLIIHTFNHFHIITVESK